MTYTSFNFIVFVAALFVIYYILPKRIRWVSLLAASYGFYYLAAGFAMMGYILFTTITVFFTGIIVEKINNKGNLLVSNIPKEERDKRKQVKNRTKLKKRGVLAVGLLLNLGLLAVIKYGNFVILNLESLFSADIGTLDILLPLGISFYTFQSTGYIIDVYRGKVKADKNIFKFGLFVSYFPQIVQGPISRYDQLANQLYEGHSFDFTRVKYGLMLIIWGFFKKLVIADRAVVLVSTMLANAGDYSGFEVAVGSIAYCVQIYADFSGGIDISIGVSLILGINLTSNFARPYFAVSMADFWRRWHITLGAWFRDYVFYSLTLSKPFSKFMSWTRKNLGDYLGKLLPSTISMGIVFLLVGIWHGAAWKYIAYGLYNSIIIMVGMIFTPFLQDLNSKYHFIKTDTLSWRILLTVITFMLVVLGRIFVISDGLRQAFTLMKSMFSEFNPWIFVDGTIYELGLSFPEFSILILSIIILFVVDLVQESGIKIRESLDTQNTFFRWALILGCIFFILIFGVYGDVTPQDFIYQQF